MATIYDKADKEAVELVSNVMAQHHSDLANMEVSVNVLWALAFDKEGAPIPAMKTRGQMILAKTSITNLQDRVRGLPDAKLIIDVEYGWRRLAPDRRRALIDHELTHLALVFDSEGLPKRDDVKRPKLTLRHHDWELTGFASVAERHGEAAIEAMQIRYFAEAWGQYCLFPLPGTTIVNGQDAAK